LVLADFVAVTVGVIWLLTVKKAIVPETGNISHRLSSVHSCNSTVGNCWAQVGLTVRLYTLSKDIYCFWSTLSIAV
jgi:hypothetical protein